MSDLKSSASDTRQNKKQTHTQLKKAWPVPEQMTYQVHINRMIEGDSALRALATVRFGEFLIHDVKLLSSQNGYFLGMPSRSYKDKEGKDVYYDIFHPISATGRRDLTDAVIAAYEQEKTMQQQNEQQSAESFAELAF